MTQTHTSRDFELELRELRAQVLAMGARCERAVQLALDAFLANAPSAPGDVAALDRQIDQDETSIGALALRILALRQPVAFDLRLLMGVVRLATDLERIGDEAENIAERARSGGRPTADKTQAEIRSMGEAARQMLRRGLSAFSDSDPEQAESVLGQDDVVDGHYWSIMTGMTPFITENPAQAGEALRLMQVSKCLERIADHATNIAEEVIFIVRGEDVRHRPRPPQRST